MNKEFFPRSTGLFLALALAVSLRAAAPAAINYQGKLSDPAGGPLTGSYAMLFEVYDAPTGGALLHAESHPGTGVVNGVFSALLGVPPSVLQGGTGRYLQVTVNGTALWPRQLLAAAPYALAVSTGSVGPAEIKSGAVGDDKISDVDWGKLANVPAGFADGVDDGQTAFMVDSAVVVTGAVMHVPGAQFSVVPGPGGRADFSLNASSVTLAGNVFNAPNRLLKLDGAGDLLLPAGRVAVGPLAPSAMLTVDAAAASPLTAGAFTNNLDNSGRGGSAWALSGLASRAANMTNVGVSGSAGAASAEAIGVQGSASTSPGSNYGVYASAAGDPGDKIGVYAGASGNGGIKYGLFARAAGAGLNYAGYFAGDVAVEGTLQLLNNPLAADQGGTGLRAVSPGDLLYGAGTNAWGRLPVASSANGNVLTLENGLPAWKAPSGGGGVSGGFTTVGQLSRWDGTGLAPSSLIDDGQGRIAIGPANPRSPFHVESTEDVDVEATIFNDSSAPSGVGYGVDARSMCTGNTTNAGLFSVGSGASYSNIGVDGRANGGPASISIGVSGQAQNSGNNYGVMGLAIGTAGAGVNFGVYGSARDGAANYAGYFQGDVEVTGALRAGSLNVSGTKNFHIRHPLDPDGRTLTHAALEAPEAGVSYRGEARLEKGRATVKLPDYFEALTRTEQRTVQLTCVGGASLLYVEGPVRDGAFAVKTTADGDPGQAFYWEVRAVRKDVPPLEVEREMTAQDRRFFEGAGAKR